jgi:hypothetical protein
VWERRVLEADFVYLVLRCTMAVVTISRLEALYLLFILLLSFMHS